MAPPIVPRDEFFEKVINPYLAGVLQHPQSIEMHEGVLHIRYVEGPKKTGIVEAWLEAMEEQVFKCQGMVEPGLNANHVMITEFTNKHKIDDNDIGKHLSRIYDRIDNLQAQIYDLQNQNCEMVNATCNSTFGNPGSASSGQQQGTGGEAQDGDHYEQQDDVPPPPPPPKSLTMAQFLQALREERQANNSGIQQLVQTLVKNPLQNGNGNCRSTLSEFLRTMPPIFTETT
ncbi:40S ribosomal protein S5-1 [Hordeum vulgare]|nr:40S ribosomal protein S5-1 [Hordeum vulgare]